MRRAAAFAMVAVLAAALAGCGPAGRPVTTADQAISLAHESLRGTPAVAGPFAAAREGDIWRVRTPAGPAHPAAEVLIDARTGRVVTTS